MKAEGKETANVPSGEIRFPRAREVWPEAGKMGAGHRLGCELVERRCGDIWRGVEKRECQQRDQPLPPQRAGHVMDTMAGTRGGMMECQERLEFEFNPKHWKIVKESNII